MKQRTYRFTRPCYRCVFSMNKYILTKMQLRKLQSVAHCNYRKRKGDGIENKVHGKIAAEGPKWNAGSQDGIIWNDAELGEGGVINRSFILLIPSFDADNQNKGSLPLDNAFLLIPNFFNISNKTLLCLLTCIIKGESSSRN